MTFRDFASAVCRIRVIANMHKTILSVSEDASSRHSVQCALKDAGYESAGTSSSFQAMALLFVLQGIVAVVIDERNKTQPDFELARKLRTIRAGIPIIVVCRDPVECLPGYLDACVFGEEPLRKLLYVLDRVLDVCNDAA